MKIDIELHGYDDEDGAFIDNRIDCLKDGVLAFIAAFGGLPHIGISFWDGNMGVKLFNILFSVVEGNTTIYFYFSAE